MFVANNILRKAAIDIDLARQNLRSCRSGAAKERDNRENAPHFIFLRNASAIAYFHLTVLRRTITAHIISPVGGDKWQTTRRK